jgi:hypothetical protein
MALLHPTLKGTHKLDVFEKSDEEKYFDLRTRK